jgi:hypothetical protein
MQKKRTGLYNALVVLPDRLYPFKTEVGGQWVRGIRSYNAVLARYQKMYGDGRYGYKLGAYRQFFHLIGSILFLIVAAYFSQAFFKNADAMYAFLIAAVGLVSFQEFYVHRRMYQQLWRKGIIDWLAWCTPIGIYFFSHFR